MLLVWLSQLHNHIPGHTPSTAYSSPGHRTLTTHGYSIRGRPSGNPASFLKIRHSSLWQRKHALEGAPDPFPSFSVSGNDEPKAKRPITNSASASLDTDSQTAFPSLAPSAPQAKQTTSTVWGGATAPRIKSTAPKSKLVSESFNLNAIDLSHAGKDGKPGTLGDVMKNIMTRFKVKVEASTQRKTGHTTFFVKGESEREVEKAKRQLVAWLSPVVCGPIFFPHRPFKDHVCRSHSPSMPRLPQLLLSSVPKVKLILNDLSFPIDTCFFRRLPQTYA